MRTWLQRGDLVEVKSAAEILATLDADATFQKMPFMPEMVPFCGQRFRVYRRADKVCDTIALNHTSRSPGDTVILVMERCTGDAHGGCQAECRMYWKETWLRRVDEDDATPAPIAPADEAIAELVALTTAATSREGDGGTIRYRCQATQLVDASTKLSLRDPASYTRELTRGNVPTLEWTRVMIRAVNMQTRTKFGRLPLAPLRGASSKSPTYPLLDLQPGEWVRVKSPEQIEKTLTDKGMHRGLWFDREFLPYCGKVFKVRQRVTQIIDEPTGEMRHFSSDCIMLEGTACSGELSPGRWFCPRNIQIYWRECWLERVDAPSTT